MFNKNKFFGNKISYNKISKQKTDDLLIVDSNEQIETSSDIFSSNISLNSRSRFSSGNQEQNFNSIEKNYSFNSKETEGNNTFFTTNSKSPTNSNNSKESLESKSKDSLFQTQARKKRAFSIMGSNPNIDLTPALNLKNNFIHNNEPINYIPQISIKLDHNLNFQLPIPEFNKSIIMLEINFLKTKQNINLLEKNLEKTELKLDLIKKNIHDLSSKSITLRQNTEIISQKLKLLNNWIENQDIESNIGIQTIEWFVWFFSYLSSILIIIFQAIKRPNKKKKL